MYNQNTKSKCAKMFPNKVYVCFVYILIKLVAIEKKLFTNYAAVF